MSSAPTSIPSYEGFPTDVQFTLAVDDSKTEIERINEVVRAHNEAARNFKALQSEAEESIQKHHVARAKEEFEFLTNQVDETTLEDTTAKADLQSLIGDIQNLEQQVREHGPAAAVINELLQSYLGHSELTVAPITNGYSFCRNGKAITGLPSEGERTAIALCYFLSMLQSDGRKLGNLVVIVDDPISSLDTRSLNFACSLIKNALKNCAQLFVLTHNQNCLNEFRKTWKTRSLATDGKDPIAGLFFLDVSKLNKESARISKLGPLPKLLREYDSEYHYLINHILKYAETSAEYEYSYMMPNVMRRALDVFLAFRCPGNAGLASKIEQLSAAYKGLDKNRVSALKRLAQVESHSDNLDDLIEFSSMTIEESKEAAASLVAIYEHVDPAHLAGLRRICV